MNLRKYQLGYIGFSFFSPGGSRGFKAEIASQASFDVATYLSAQSVPTNQAVELTVPSANIVGTLTTGDISGYTKGVTLIIEGEVQGAGGAANGGAGGHAIYANNSSNL